MKRLALKNKISNVLTFFFGVSRNPSLGYTIFVTLFASILLLTVAWAGSRILEVQAVNNNRVQTVPQIVSVKRWILLFGNYGLGGGSPLNPMSAIYRVEYKFYTDGKLIEKSEWVDRYTRDDIRNKQAFVMYDATNPQKSYLSSGADWSQWTIINSGIVIRSVLALVASAYASFTIYRYRKNKRQARMKKIVG